MYKAEQIKSTLNMRQVAEFYGHKINSNGLMICPFHNDTKPSLKVYEGSRGFYCYSCGTGGDVIEFVSKLYGLKFMDTICKLNIDFHLNLELDKANQIYKPKLLTKQETAKKQRLEAIETWLKRAEDITTTYIRLLWKTQNKFKPTNENFNNIYSYALTQLNYYEGVHQKVFIEGDFEIKLAFYQQNRKEVDKLEEIINTARKVGVIG